jgi:hypothetical protein
VGGVLTWVVECEDGNATLRVLCENALVLCCARAYGGRVRRDARVKWCLRGDGGCRSPTLLHAMNSRSSPRVARASPLAAPRLACNTDPPSAVDPLPVFAMADERLINEAYKIWKRNTPFLCTFFLCVVNFFALPCSSRFLSLRALRGCS